jgi:two-component system, OmpR family, sensor histidine kinase KdpD
MPDDKSNEFLRMIRLARRGRLKIYLGYSAGVGKTYQMLQEGQRLKSDGVDVVIGLLETHGRADIVALARGLETVPRSGQDYHGIALEEMDVDAVIARRPQVALIDELAHTNAPGRRNAKRYEDVQEILAAGIHVITTLNVQHLESLYNVVEASVGVKVRERLPDSVLAEADQIVDVDLATEDLRRRLEEGKVYPPDRIGTALENFFRPDNLEKLRELTLRELAAQIDLRRREAEEDQGAAADQVMVCLSSHGPNSARLLRYGSRLAGKLNRNWYALYVQTPAEEATVIDAGVQRTLADTLTLAKQLGATVFTYKGQDVADTILRFAREYRVGHLVVGSSGARPFWKRFGRNRAIVETLIRNGAGLSVIVLDTSEAGPAGRPGPERPPTGEAPGEDQEDTRPVAREHPRLSRWVTASRVRIWDQPVAKADVLRALAAAARPETMTGRTEDLFRDILAREAQGSTFFNEGVAFPHVRIADLPAPVIAVGIAKKGIADVPTLRPVEVIFLILSPASDPDVQVELLAVASRAAQNRIFLQKLKQARTPEEAMAAIGDRERATSA